MCPKADHTREVERRVAAIPVKATDCCSFYAPRGSALIPLRECWYCSHGAFRRDTADPHEPGFCKFKK